MSGRYLTNQPVVGQYPAQHVRSRAPLHEGANIQQPTTDNPKVSSKSSRRYGHNETHGEQRTSPAGRPVPGSLPVQHSVPAGHPVSRQVGYLGGGSEKQVAPTHPNTNATTGGLHPSKGRR